MSDDDDDDNNNDDDTPETMPTKALDVEPETTHTIVVHNNVHSTVGGTVSNKVIGTRTLAIAGALVMLSMAIVWFYIPHFKSSAQNDMRSFISFHKTNKDLAEIQDLETDSISSYAQAYCVTLDSADKVRAALRDELDQVPVEVRESVIKRAVVEGATLKSSLDNSAAKFASEGRAYFFKAFWSTAYDRRLTSETYTTCVVVSGVEIEIAEVVAGWHKETKKVQIGVEKCDCGYILPCSICPVFDIVTTEAPIFKRHSLTLKQQGDLHLWLAKKALFKAEELFGSFHTPAITSSEPDRKGIEWSTPNSEPLFYNRHDLMLESGTAKHE